MKSSYLQLELMCSKQMYSVCVQYERNWDLCTTCTQRLHITKFYNNTDVGLWGTLEGLSLLCLVLALTT